MGVETMITAPVNLLEIIEIIGEAAALKLVERFGGTTPRLPALRTLRQAQGDPSTGSGRADVGIEHPLAQCIGIEALTKLVTVTGGGRWLYVAKCARGLRAARNREIVTLYSPPNNVSVAELALRYHLSDRQIWNILGSTVVDDRQQSFF